MATQLKADPAPPLTTAGSIQGLPTEAPAVKLHEIDNKVGAIEVEVVTAKESLEAANAANKVEKEREGPVVEGMEDERLWSLMRRFNLQIAHVLSPPTFLPPGEPDLRITQLPAVSFTTEVLRGNVERLYDSVGVVLIVFITEVIRLTSWDREERLRTALFSVVYFAAAFTGMVIPLITGLLISLVLFPSSRRILFPLPRPTTDNLRPFTDPSQTLLDTNSTIDHPSEAHKPYTAKRIEIERQLAELADLIGRFGVRRLLKGTSKAARREAAGNTEVGAKFHPATSSDSSDEDEQEEKSGEKEQEVGRKEAKRLKKEESKAAYRKFDEIVNSLGRTVQDATGSIADFFEVFANALSPPTCYKRTFAREKISTLVLVPILILTAIVPAHYWATLVSISIGIGFFAQPLLIRAGKKFVKLVPDWREKVNLRNSILSGVPTDSQLVLHLLREHERQLSPLPPPPPAPSVNEKKEQLQEHVIDTPVDDPTTSTVSSDAEEEEEEEEGSPKKEGVRMRAFKAGGKKMVAGMQKVMGKVATVGADVSVEGSRQKVGSKLDRLLYQTRAKDDESPSTYPAKLNSTSGHLSLSLSPPTLTFTPLSSSHTVQTRPIDDIVEIKKEGVFIARALLGWAASINLAGNGMSIRFKGKHEREVDAERKRTHLMERIEKGEEVELEVFEGDVWEFEHVGRRDQLFARLVAIGGQKWESL